VLSFRARGIDEDISYVHAQSTSLSQVDEATTFWNIGMTQTSPFWRTPESMLKSAFNIEMDFRIASAIAGPE
jgi:hypothetical protein